MFESCSAAAQASCSGAVDCETGGAAGVGSSIWGLGAGVGRYVPGRPSRIVESRRAEHGGDDKQNGAFGGGAGAADAANPLRVAMR